MSQRITPVIIISNRPLPTPPCVVIEIQRELRMTLVKRVFGFIIKPVVVLLLLVIYLVGNTRAPVCALYSVWFLAIFKEI